MAFKIFKTKEERQRSQNIVSLHLAKLDYNDAIMFVGHTPANINNALEHLSEINGIHIDMAYKAEIGRVVPKETINYVKNKIEEASKLLGV